MDVQRFTEHPAVRRTVDDLQRQMEGRTLSDTADAAGRQYVDLVMEGGGVLGIALVGYLHALESVGLRFMSIGGTSAGSITALLLAALDTKETAKSEAMLHHLARQDLGALVDGNRRARRFIDAALGGAGKLRLGWHAWRAWGTLKEKLGLNPGSEFLRWIAGILDEQDMNTTAALQARMAHRPPGLNPDINFRLALITAEVTTETKVEFPKMAPLFWHDAADVHPAQYVRASMSIPFFFYPYHLKDLPRGPAAQAEWAKLASYDGALGRRCTFVDGGIMSNFPIDIFHAPYRVPRAPTFGVKLGVERRQQRTIEKVPQLGWAAFTSARHTLDYDFITRNPDYEQLLTYIDTGEHSWLDFDLTDEAKIDLFRRGVEAGAQFVWNFDWDGYKGIRRHLADAFLSAHPDAEPQVA